MADDDGYEQNEDNINYKSISCEKIPELFLDKLVAKKHFSKYGKINRFILRPNRLCCTVDYETENDAANAYQNAGNFNGQEFIINYAEKEVGHVQNTEEWVDPDVQAELDSMGQGGHRRSGLSTNMRPSMMKPPMATRTVKPAVQKPTRSAASLPQMPAPQVVEQAPPPMKVDAGVRAELEAVLRRPAYCEEDKYRVLDARDKLIRLTTVRQTDIKKAVSTKGNCPDMCPEKERLMREYQRQVSSFEMNNANSTINHRRAIKEYSRSSADQEVPLSHELRAEDVLQLTMLYVMHCILDLCDDPQTSIADWFHFVWDRTRSVRKDITQQELCSLGAVQLVEQCARFHIHCAARLVAEDPSVFDKKINAENLTKCLQTLKYMYHDLRIRQVRCPCEAEFRGYIVLLNLGDANFLWELKQLPAEIQNSADIKRAIAFYNALQNNNYVRFFNMIRAPETSYLSACILLGYFIKLRLKAMEAIIKSHNWRKNAVSLPLPYLTRVLGFENVLAARGFFSAHGLHCNEERVTLDRLSMPDMEYSMERAMLLVESKRNVSVGECVCGHPLESRTIFENHEPHNSFDSNGLLKPEAWMAEDQLRGEAAAMRKMRPPRTQTQQQQTRTQSTALQPQQQQQLAPPTSTKTADNIFKIPLTSAPISPKQQNKQQQHNTNKSMPPSASIFGGDYIDSYASRAVMPAKHSYAELASVSYGAAVVATTSSVPPSSSATTSALAAHSIFKIPMAGSGNASAKQKPTEASSATAFFTSVFKPNAEQTATKSIFGGANSTSSTSSDNRQSLSISDNIFGTAAKQTAHIFQQPEQILEPQPLQTDNIFKHFQSTMPSAFGAPADGTSIFAAAAAVAKTPEQQYKTELQAKQDAEMLERKYQLEHERQQKLEELKQERRKLQELEEKQLRKRKEAERKQLLEALQQKAEEETKLQLKTLLLEEIEAVAVAELAKCHALEQRTRQLTAELIEECVLMQVTEIQNEEYALMCHDQMILHRYFDRWLQLTRKKFEQRKLMESTPIWVTNETRTQQTQQLQHPRQVENLQMIKRYRLGEPCNFKALLRNVGGIRAPRPIDLHQLIAKHALRKQTIKGGMLQQRKYFKLLLTLPGELEELPGFESMCKRWLRKYVQRSSDNEDNEAIYINGVAHDVALCMRRLTGMKPTNEAGQRVRNESDNADAIVCLMTGDNLRNTRRRLQYLLKLSKLYKPIPIAFVVYNACVDERSLESCLELSSFVEENIVSNFLFCGCLENKNDFNFYDNFRRALRFVARESSFTNAEAESLEMQSLQSWFECTLGEEMWQRWQDSCLKNPVFSKICSMPRFVIELYNAALKRLQEIIGEDHAEAPEFPEELRQFVPSLQCDRPAGLEHFPSDWKSAAHCQQLLNFLEQLKLPLLSESLPLNDIEDLELCLLNYACRCSPHDDEAATHAGYQSIKALIESLNRADLQDLELPTRLALISWLPVIKPIAYMHINHMLHSSSAATLPKVVVYRRQTLIDYREHPWWLNFEPLYAVTMDYTLKELPGMDSTQYDCAQESAEDVATVLEQAELVSRKSEQKLLSLRHQTSKTFDTDLTRELDESFYQFELAKKCGSYDVVGSEKLQDYDLELDADELELLGAVGGTNGNILSLGRKRKRAEPISEMNDIMAKAFALIERVEGREDGVRMKKINSNELSLDDSSFQF